MYGRSKFFYDIIYRSKNYRQESDRVHQLILQYKKAKGNRLLDVACGTGNHLTYLKDRYALEGLDLDPDMLRQARKKHPDVMFHQGDMTSFKLKQHYDIITCLFSSIGHVKTRTRLRQAIRTMAEHLKPGGLLIVEPWITPDRYEAGRITANFVDQPRLKLARMAISRRKKNLSVQHYHHLVASPRGFEYFVERAEMGLFPHREYQKAFQNAGLRASYDAYGLTGRGLYLGLKPDG